MDGAIEASRLAGNDQTLAWDLMNRAFVDVHRGEMESAMAAAEESMELTRELGDGFVSTHAGVMLAIARLENGEPARAVDLFVSAGGGEAMPLLPGGWRAKYLDLLTRGWLQIGKLDEAGRVAGHAAGGRRRDRPRHGDGLGAARRGRRRARARRGGRRPPKRALESAAALRGRRRSLRGRGLARAGRPGLGTRRRRASAPSRSSARHRVLRGVRRAALPARGRARAAQARSCRPPPHPPGKADEHGIASLSERELELARLVVDRKTNPEIAAALFLSQKTVESHLRNIFRKLDVASRVELARAVERADRAG